MRNLAFMTRGTNNKSLNKRTRFQADLRISGNDCRVSNEVLHKRYTLLLIFIKRNRKSSARIADNSLSNKMSSLCYKTDTCQTFEIRFMVKDFLMTHLQLMRL